MNPARDMPSLSRAALKLLLQAQGACDRSLKLLCSAFRAVGILPEDTTGGHLQIARRQAQKSSSCLNVRQHLHTISILSFCAESAQQMLWDGTQ